MKAEMEDAMTTMLMIAGPVTVVAGRAARSRAHHAFGGEFDANRPVLLKGTVVKVEWVNPHAWIHIEVKTARRHDRKCG